MTQSEHGAQLVTWNAPACPFLIEYSPRVLDDIRLAVTDAFFSVPRGGAEIGGILLGDWNGQRLTIAAFAALDCEHALGPSFTLSPRDEAALGELLAMRRPNGLRTVGWYHSHTRSEIFLSDKDVAIHRRYFPEPWQVALVMKPHTFQPMRAGFFYQGADGSMRTESSDNESALAILGGAPAPAVPLARPEPAAASRKIPLPPDILPDPPQAQAAAPVAEPEPLPEQPISVPKFLDTPEPPSKLRSRFIKFALVITLLDVACYLTRDFWMPQVGYLVQKLSAPPPLAPMGLNTLDSLGQLQIRWNPASTSVQNAIRATLSINTGQGEPQEITLDRAHLLSGAFTVARRTDRVDVTLSLIEQDGRLAREVTTFMGLAPGSKPAPDPAAQEQGEKLVNQMQKIQSDLDAEIERNAKLKKSMDRLSQQIRDEQWIRQHPVGKN